MTVLADTCVLILSNSVLYRYKYSINRWNVQVMQIVFIEQGALNVMPTGGAVSLRPLAVLLGSGVTLLEKKHKEWNKKYQ